MLGFDWKCLECFKKDLIKWHVFSLPKYTVGCISYMVALTPVSPPDDEGGIRARHSSILEAKSTSIRGSLASPMISCLEKRSKSYSSIQRVLFVMSL